MIKLLHSADWQIGARFRQFGAVAGRLRAARLATLRRSLEVARERAVDGFLVAGDLFEDNQIDDAAVGEVVGLFREFSSVPVFLLPGNHDPNSGPESVWNRKVFLDPPANVRVLREPGVVELGGAVLVASPLLQKRSTVDPSLRLAELARELPADRIKLGITHGALAIEGKHQANDFPIALDAASRAGLDYLAIGHWHNWLAETDGGRIVMPGTPEPDQFEQDRSGNVALVEIDGPGAPPRVDPVRVATLTWRPLEVDFLSEEASRATVEQTLAELRQNAAQTVLRVRLSGSASPEAVAAAKSHLAEATAGFFFVQVIDATRVALGAPELADLRIRHPILAQVLADIDQLERFATGTSPAGSDDATNAMTLGEARELLAAAKIDLAALTAEFFSQLRQVVFQTLQEVSE